MNANSYKQLEERDAYIEELRAQLKEAQEAAEFNFQQYQDAGRLLCEAQAEIERLKENNNAGLDTNPNNTESKQQRELVSAVEMGQLLERGKDKDAGNPKTQGVIVLTGVDEYGPLLHWHTHWVDFEDGTNFYSEQQLKEAQAEIEQWKANSQENKLIAASQAREQQLREALQTYVDEHEECTDPDDWMAMTCSIEAHHVADEAISLPSDTTALEAMIAKAGEVMRERCVSVTTKIMTGGLDAYGNAIRALPGVTLEDLK